jgi:hypothetical protein
MSDETASEVTETAPEEEQPAEVSQEAASEETVAQEPASLADSIPDEAVAPEPTPLPETVGEYGDFSKFESTEALAKSYSELQKHLTKVRQEQSKAPEEYNQEIIPDGLSVGDNTFEQFKEYGLTEDQAAGVLKIFADAIQPIAERSVELDRKELMSRWGLTSETAFTNRAVAVKNWVKGKMGEDAARNFLKDVDNFAAAHMMMRAENQEKALPETQPYVAKQITQDDINKLIGDPRYDYDRGLQAQARELIEQFNKQKSA